MTKPIYGASSLQPRSTVQEVIAHLAALPRQAHCMIKAAMKDALLKQVGIPKDPSVATNPNGLFGASAAQVKAAHANRNAATKPDQTPSNTRPRGK